MTKQDIVKIFDDTNYILENVLTASSDYQIDIENLKKINNPDSYDDYDGDTDLVDAQTYCKERVESIRHTFGEMSGLNLDDLDYDAFLEMLDLFISNRHLKMARAIVDEIKYNESCKDIIIKGLQEREDMGIIADNAMTKILEETTLEDIMESYFMEQCLYHTINIDFDGTGGFYDVFMNALSDFDGTDVIVMEDFRNTFINQLKVAFAIVI